MTCGIIYSILTPTQSTMDFGKICKPKLTLKTGGTCKKTPYMIMFFVVPPSNTDEPRLWNEVALYGTEAFIANQAERSFLA